MASAGSAVNLKPGLSPEPGSAYRSNSDFKLEYCHHKLERTRNQQTSVSSLSLSARAGPGARSVTTGTVTTRLP